MNKGNFINNYYIDPDFNLENKYVRAVIISRGIPGKEYFLYRLTGYYSSENFLSTIGFEYRILKFEFNHNKFNIKIYNSNFLERYRHFPKSLFRNVEIFIYLIDLTDTEEGIDVDFIREIKLNIPYKALIYLVGNKLDLVEDENNKYIDNLMRCREKAKLLIENKDIYNYFEVSAKNNKGIDNLLKNIKWYILRDAKCHDSNFESKRSYGNRNILKLSKRKKKDDHNKDHKNNSSNNKSYYKKKFHKSNFRTDKSLLDKYLNM